MRNPKSFSFLIFIVSLPVFCFTQPLPKDKLTGFWGIDWLTDSETVKIAAQSKTDFTIVQETPNGLHGNGIFGGSEVKIMFLFANSKMYQGFVIYAYKTNLARRTYKNAKEQIESRYGKPDEEIEKYYSPYFLGDGYEELAIKLNKGRVSAKWIFGDGNTIQIFITSKLSTYVVYTNVEIAKEVEKTKAEKAATDF